MKKTLITGHNAITVRWDDEYVSNLMKHMFSPWHGRSDESKHHVLIRKETSDYCISASGAPPFRIDESALVSGIEQAITVTACRALREYMQIHAAILDFEGTGVMICGAHGSGKTTLALTALASGWTVLTDDVAVCESDNRTALGFPRPLRIREGTRHLLPSLIPENCPFTVSPDGIMHLYHTAPGLHFYLPETRLGYIIFPSRRPGKTVLRDIGEREALTFLLPMGFNYYLRRDGRLYDLIALIRQTRTMELFFSDHWDVIHALRDIIVNQS